MTIKVYSREVSVCEEHGEWARVTAEPNDQSRQTFQLKCNPKKKNGQKAQQKQHWFVIKPRRSRQNWTGQIALPRKSSNLNGIWHRN